MGSGDSKTMTTEHPFEVRLRLRELPEPVEDLLVEQLDAIVSRFAEVPYVTVLQDAESGTLAAHRVVDQVRHLGGEVLAIDFDYVTRGEIAERLETTRQAVAHWVAGERQAAFPFPLPAIQAGVSLWCWSDVVNWARVSNRAFSEDVRLMSADEITMINGELAAGRMPIFASGSPPPIHRPRHESRLLIRVRGPQSPHNGVEPVLLDHALDPGFGHLLLNPHLANKGARSSRRREAASAWRSEGAVGVVADPPGAGVANGQEDLFDMRLGNINNQRVQLRHGNILSINFGYKQVSTIANHPTTADHGYVHRLGQSQDCELRGLGARGRTRQLNVVPQEWARWGRPFFR
jgi:hypothetical protein